jgi:hypothetical protein
MEIDNNFKELTKALELRQKALEKFQEYGIRDTIKDTAHDILDSGFLDVKQAKHCCAFTVVVLENLLVEGKIILQKRGE